jgi:hypothetical protein
MAGSGRQGLFRAGCGRGLPESLVFRPFLRVLCHFRPGQGRLPVCLRLRPEPILSLAARAHAGGQRRDQGEIYPPGHPAWLCDRKPDLREPLTPMFFFPSLAPMLMVDPAAADTNGLNRARTDAIIDAHIKAGYFPAHLNTSTNRWPQSEKGDIPGLSGRGAARFLFRHYKINPFGIIEELYPGNAPGRMRRACGNLR